MIVVARSVWVSTYQNQAVWRRLVKAFPDAEIIHPSTVVGDRLVDLGGEPLWLIGAPKHSRSDVVTVFRGVAMTGDIELGMLKSVNSEVHWVTKMRSMDWYRQFPKRANYHVHTTISAHLNSLRFGIHWPDLFTYQDALRKQCLRCGGKLQTMAMDFAGFDRR